MQAPGVIEDKRWWNDAHLWPTKRSCRHCMVFKSRLAISWRQVRPCVVPTLVVVVLNIQTGEFGETDAQSAACIIDVLSIQSLCSDKLHKLSALKQNKQTGI